MERLRSPTDLSPTQGTLFEEQKQVGGRWYNPLEWRRTTRILSITTLIFFILSITFLVLYIPKEKTTQMVQASVRAQAASLHAPRPSCESVECQELAKTMAASMDIQADACTDFYKFSCGKWKSEFPQARSVNHQIALQNKMVYESLLDKLSQQVPDKARTPQQRHQKKLVDFYQSCLRVDGDSYKRRMENEIDGFDSIREKGVAENRPMTEILTDMASWMMLHGLFPFFELVWDLHPPNKIIKLAIKRYRDFYGNSDDDDEPVGAVRVPHRGCAGFSLRSNEWDVARPRARRAKRDLALDATLSITNFLRLDHKIRLAIENVPQGQLHPSSNAEAGNYSTIFDWQRFLANLKAGSAGAESPPVVHALYPATLEAIDRTLREQLNSDTDLIFSYMRAQVTIGLAQIATSRDVDGSGLPRSSVCIDYLMADLEYLLTREFADLTLPLSSFELITKAVDGIKKSYVDSIVSAEWLDQSAKSLLLTKLQDIRVHVPYPKSDPEISSHEALERWHNDLEVNNDFGSNVMSNLAFRMQKLYSILGTEYEEAWSIVEESPLEVNAVYYDGLNDAIIALGYLQWPTFLPKAPEYFNFGSKLGSVIGHEIGHAFDPNYIGDTPSGVGWQMLNFSTNVRNIYDAKVKCLIDQYARFGIDGMMLRSDIAIGEIFADNLGLSAAFSAWQKSLSNPGADWDNMPLPGVKDLTIEQAFFVAHAQQHCDDRSPDESKALLMRIEFGGAVHPPNAFRVQGSVMNSAPFLKAFNCKTTQPQCEILQP